MRRPFVIGFSSAALAISGWLAVSLGEALRTPGTDTAPQRLVEWARDHELGPMIDAAERRYYAATEPDEGGVPTTEDQLTALVADPATTGAVTSGERPPADLSSPVIPALDGEGRWTPFGPLVGGRHVAWTTSLRPDAKHTSALVRIVWMERDAFRFEQHPGDKLEKPWARPNFVAPEEQSTLVAAFSDGFRLSGSKGGFYLLGKEKRKLRAEAASLVVDLHGRPGVGLVPRDYALADLESVRQNLDLIVDDGAVDPRLVKEPNAQWGYTGPDNKTATWRSGAGVRADGSFLYVAGPALSITTLAETLVKAGAVRGMQLEINREWITFSSYTADDSGKIKARKLDARMVHPADRYLTEDTRDFMAVLRRPEAAAPGPPGATGPASPKRAPTP